MVSPPGTQFTAESNEAMRTKCLAQGHKILTHPGFELSIAVSRNLHLSNMLHYLCLKLKQQSIHQAIYYL